MPKRRPNPRHHGPDPSMEGNDPLLERQRQLQLQLRTMFAHVVEEEVPADFAELLEQLQETPKTGQTDV